MLVVLLIIMLVNSLGPFHMTLALRWNYPQIRAEYGCITLIPEDNYV